nr:DUF3367 domain-containing protein [Thermoleophilaceae bacterium]
KGLTFAYNNAGPVDFLRTTYKASPLLALAIACLGGAAAASVPRRFRLPALGGLALIAAAFAAPLVAGRAVDAELAYGSVPGEWREAVKDAGAATGDDRRTLLLPGQLFGFYQWGETLSSIGPAIAERPFATREVVPYADRRSAQLLATLDDLVQQGRLVPGQLSGLLALTGSGQVLVSSDARRVQSGGLDPAGTAASLAGSLERPARTYGRAHRFPRAWGRGGDPRTLPRISRHDAPGLPLVRVAPLDPRAVVDGDAEGVAELAAHGALDPRGGLAYAGDLDRAEVEQAVRGGATLVFSDSARKRILASSRLRLNHGPTLTAPATASEDAVVSDLFPGRGDGGRTVARYSGLRDLDARLSPGYSLFPEHRPYAALDGRLDTSWLADPNLEDPQRFIELELDAPRRVDAVRLYPHIDAKGRTARVAISVNGGAERELRLDPGWNEISLRAKALRKLKIRIAKVIGPKERGGGGIDEIAVPGLRVEESLRLPTALARDARGADLARSPMAVLLSRTSTDFPYRAGADEPEPQNRSPLRAVDAERGMERDVTLPAGRTFTPSGWASVSPRAPDPAIDALAGGSDEARFSSSGRFEGVPAHRASSAFDGDPGTAWVGATGEGTPWIEVESRRELWLESGTIETHSFGRPREISVNGVRAAVEESGAFTLPRPVAARRIRFEVLSTGRSPRGQPAVGIAELRVAGFPQARRRAGGRFATRCGELRANGARMR